MSILEYAVSAIALLWLFFLAVQEVRKSATSHISWILIPMTAAAVYRLLVGPSLVVLVAVILVLVSDRQQLKNRLVEWMVAIAALVAVALILVSAEPLVSVAGVCMLIIWIGWEFRLSAEQEAIILITCLLVWPMVYFLFAYMVVAILWYIGIRIKEGRWREAHPAPGMVLIAIAGVATVILRFLGLE